MADIATGAGINGVLGWMTPELFTLAGLAAGAFPATASAAPFLLEAGVTARTARIPAALSGAFGGATGETAGQLYEKKYGPGVGAETARLLGSIITPTGLAGAATGTGKALVGGLGLAFPKIKVATTLGEMLKERGITPQSIEKLSAEKKAFIESKLAELRGGGERSVQAQREIFSMLEQEVGRVSRAAEGKALAFEREADRLLNEVTAKQGVITADTEKRIARLRSQFDEAADKLRSDAGKNALDATRSAARRSAIIRKNAANQSEEVKRAAEAEASKIETEAQQQAQSLLRGAEKRIATLQSRYENRQSILDMYRGRMQGQAEAARGAIGERILPGQMGEEVRGVFETRLNALKDARDKAYETVKNTWLNTIKGKEASGQTYRQTRSYQEALANLNRELVTENKMLAVTDPKSVEQVKSVISQINPVRESTDKAGNVIRTEVPASVASLEVLLRRLKDRAGGLPAEGVEAIDQQRAGRLAQQVENIIDEFSAGSYKKAKDTYRELSKPINEFNTSVGKYVTEKPEGFEVGDFMSRLGKVGPKVFENRFTAKQLFDVAGAEKSEQLALGYLADKIGPEPTADKIRSVLESNRDWLALPEFKAIGSQLEAAAGQMSRATTRSKQAGILSKALGVKIGQLPELPTKQAQKITSTAEKEAAQVRQKAEKETGRIGTEAERKIAGLTPDTAALRQEAKAQVDASAISVESRIEDMLRQAEQQRAAASKETEAAIAPLTAQAKAARSDAEAFENLILGTATQAKRVESFLTGGNRQEWEQISRILNQTPGGREKVAEAVGQIIAARFESGPKSAINLLSDMRSNLLDYGLMDRAAIDKLERTMNEVYNAPVQATVKRRFLETAVRNAIVGATAFPYSKVFRDAEIERNRMKAR